HQRRDDREILRLTSQEHAGRRSHQRVQVQGQSRQARRSVGSCWYCCFCLAEARAGAIDMKTQCGRGGTVDATDLNDLSALWETEDAELLKFGGTSHVAIP